MYNEIDRLILDTIVRCSHCDSENVKCYNLTTTIAACGNTPADSFRMHTATHEHDSNQISASYDCSDCNKKFHIIPLNACWCGWTQNSILDRRGYKQI